MRILFLSGWFPYPPNNGSKLRIYNLLRGLAKHHEITLLAFTDQPAVVSDEPELRSLCRDVQIVPKKSFDPQSWRARLGYFGRSPRSVPDVYSPQMAKRIEQTLRDADYDLVIASQWMMAGYASRFCGLPALLEEVEVGVLYERFSQASSVLARVRHGLTWTKHRNYLARLLNHFKACTVVSEREQQIVATIRSDFQAIAVIPNCVNLADYADVSEMAQPNNLIFTGAFSYRPNYDAMVWFLREVYPRVRAEVPDISLTITGDHANLPLPPASNVKLTGFVDDIRPLIASSWLSLAPIWAGGGTRLKILEAMALGTPVIATTKGAEGLEVQNGYHLLLADTPETFTEAVVRLSENPELRRQLAGQAYQLVQEKYNWPAVMPHFLNLVETVAQTNKATAGHSFSS